MRPVIENETYCIRSAGAYGLSPRMKSGKLIFTSLSRFSTESIRHLRRPLAETQSRQNENCRPHAQQAAQFRPQNPQSRPFQ